MLKDPLQIAKDALARAIETETRSKTLVASIGPAVISALEPVLNEILSVFKETQKKVEQSKAPEINIPPYPEIKIPTPEVTVKVSDITIPEIKIPEIKVPAPQVTVNVPEIKVPEAHVTVEMPEIKIPTPEVTVNVPEIKIPDLRWPEGEMPITGWVNLMGVDMKHPLPVQLRDAEGKPVSLGGGSAVISGGGGGQGVKILNLASEPVPISGTISATFSADFGQGATGSQTLRTVAATDSIQSVNIVSGSSSGTEYADGVVRGTATGTLLMLDDGTNIQSARGGSGNADSRTMRVVHASDAIVSVNIVSGSSSGAVGQGDSATALRVVVAGNSDASVVVNSGTLTGITNTVPVMQVSGNADSVYVTNPVDNGDAATALRVVTAGNSVASVYVNNPVAQGDAATALRVVIAGNSDASVTATQAGTWNIATLTSITNTSAFALVDSSGVAYSGSNPVPTTASVTLSAAVGQGDGASALRVIQAGDSVSSVYVNNPVDNGDAATALRVVIAGNSSATVTTSPVNAFGADGLTVDVLRTGMGLSNGSTWDRARNTSGEGNALRVQMATDAVGSVVVNSVFAPLGSILTERTVEGGSTTASFITFNAGGTNVRNYITDVVVHNSSATDGYVDFYDGLGGGAFYTFPAPQTGGVSKTFSLPLRQPSANTNLAYTVSGAISSIFISLTGFQSTN